MLLLFLVIHEKLIVVCLILSFISICLSSIHSISRVRSSEVEFKRLATILFILVRLLVLHVAMHRVNLLREERYLFKIRWAHHTIFIFLVIKFCFIRKVRSQIQLGGLTWQSLRATLLSRYSFHLEVAPDLGRVDRSTIGWRCVFRKLLRVWSRFEEL